jgi:hypothetical protein
MPEQLVGAGQEQGKGGDEVGLGGQQRGAGRAEEQPEEAKGRRGGGVGWGGKVLAVEVLQAGEAASELWVRTVLCKEATRELALASLTRAFLDRSVLNT